jgi:DNA mismatch repair protein MutL
LGHAIGQIHGRYIVAQNKEGCLIVDQHAAHERLVYEALKKQVHEGHAQSEALLIPLLISLKAPEKEALIGMEAPFKKMGLDMEILPPATLMIRAIPALLKDEDWQGVVADLLDSLRAQVSEEVATLDPLETALNLVLSRQACQRRSIKSGKRLSLEEMNALLRAMEQTPHGAQCNHGRPTYVRLEKRHLDSIFERS